jgi:ABC-type branched-subunit amino acid transport system substrate-binding protein
MWVGLFISMAVLLIVQLGGAGCAPKRPAGTEIRIGVMGGQTGPAAADVVALVEELEHVFNYMNEVEGGIDGAKLSWRIVDNRGTPEGAISAYRELRDGFDPHIYFAVEDYYLLGIKDEIEADEAVIITASAIDSRAFIPASRFFSLAIPLPDGFAGYVKWVLENHEGPGMPKIGVLYWGDVPTGQQWRTAQAWAMKQGVELETVEYSIRAIDLTPQLMRLRDAEVDYIWMLGVSGNAAVAVGGFLGLGLGGTIPFTFNEYVVADQLLGMVGEAAEGFYIYRSENPYSDGSEAAELYTKIWKSATGEDKWSDNRLLITLKAAITAAVKQAVDDVGWENLDSAAIYDALSGLTKIDTWGNTAGFGYGPTRRVGVAAMKIARFTKDGTVSVSDPITLPRTFEGIDQ